MFYPILMKNDPLTSHAVPRSLPKIWRIFTRRLAFPAAAGVLCLLFPPLRAAAGTNLTTTVVQAGGANWTAAIWKTNGTGAPTSPVAGNTYETVFNGTGIGNALNNTRIQI